jgi:hypothetical protein
LVYYAEDEDYVASEDEDANDDAAAEEDEENEEMEIDEEEIEDIKRNAEDEGNATVGKIEDGGKEDEEMKEPDKDADNQQVKEYETYWGEGEIKSDDQGWVVDCFNVEIVLKIGDLPWGTLDPTNMAKVNQDPSTGNEEPIRSLADMDITTSPPVQWWIIFPLSKANKKLRLRDDLQWILVNYEEERMYVGPLACEALVWKGRDIWDVRTWARLTTMEEIRDYGRDMS